MSPYEPGQRVRTTVECKSLWEGGTVLPTGSPGTVTGQHESVQGHVYGYGVLFDADPDRMPLFMYLFELEKEEEE